MINFREAIQKKSFKEKLARRYSSGKELPTSITRSLFAGISRMDSVTYLLSSVSLAAQEEKHFAKWFDHILEQACFDLFDREGKVKTELVALIQNANRASDYPVDRSDEMLKRALLESYCNEFVFNQITDANAKRRIVSAEWWDNALAGVLSGSNRIEGKINYFLDKQFVRLGEQWKWLCFCAKHIETRQMHFCVAVYNLHAAIAHYFHRSGVLQYGNDSIGEMISNLIARFGLISLREDQVKVLASLSNTFNHFANLRNQDEPQDFFSDSEHEFFLSLFEHREGLKVCCFNQFSIILQFIAEGVIFPGCDDLDKRAAWYSRVDDHENQTVSVFLKRLSADFLPINYAQVSTRQARALKASVDEMMKLFLRDYKSRPLASNIQWYFHMRRVLLYVFKGLPATSYELREFASDAMQILDHIDNILPEALIIAGVYRLPDQFNSAFSIGARVPTLESKALGPVEEEASSSKLVEFGVEETVFADNPIARTTVLLSVCQHVISFIKAVGRAIVNFFSMMCCCVMPQSESCSATKLGVFATKEDEDEKLGLLEVVTP